MRFDPLEVDPEAYGHLFELARHLGKTPLDRSLRDLVEIRASQINGCSFCLEMHIKRARKDGVPGRKLDLVAAWRECPDFNDDERAALALTEEVTRIGDGNRVTSETWEAARRRFDDPTLAALLYAIALINTWNLLNVAVERPPAVEAP